MPSRQFFSSLLKLRAGKRLDGRPTENTVLTVALAWSPEQSPTPQDMTAAGLSYLKKMGWQDHQALFVGHNDTKHPHFHLIINRVHPETGMLLDDHWSKIRSQRWALKYERDHGHVYCEAREAKYGHGLESDSSHLNRRDWKTWQEISNDNAFDRECREALKSGEWDALKEGQRQERIDHWKQTGRMKNALRGVLRQEVRREFTKEWQAYALHRDACTEKRRLYDQEARRALRHVRRAGGVRHGPAERKSGKDGRPYRHRLDQPGDAAKQIKERQKAYHEKLRTELFKLRSDILDRQNARFGELAEVAIAKLHAERKAAYDDVLKQHRGEKKDLRKDQVRGVRRYDVLPKPKDANSLTPEQAQAYVAHARGRITREQQRDQAGREVTSADRGRAPAPARDPPKSERKLETNDRASEKRDKDQAQEAQREYGRDWLFAKRALNRQRDRGGDGGRDR